MGAGIAVNFLSEEGDAAKVEPTIADFIVQ